MACRCCGSTLTPILAIAALVAAGATGYRVIGGGSEKSAATTKLVSEPGHCGLCPAEKTECDTSTVAQTECSAKSECTQTAEVKMSCCSEKGEAAVKLVAAPAPEAKKNGCCAAKGETACKEGTEGCTGSGENGCCGKCADKKTAEKVAGK